MKTTPRIPGHLPAPVASAPPRLVRPGLALLAAGTLLLPSLALAATKTNWVAFNEHVPSNLTAANVTTYNMRGWVLAGDASTPYPLSGPLTNYSGPGYPRKFLGNF